MKPLEVPRLSAESGNRLFTERCDGRQPPRWSVTRSSEKQDGKRRGPSTSSPSPRSRPANLSPWRRLPPPGLFSSRKPLPHRQVHIGSIVAPFRLDSRVGRLTIPVSLPSQEPMGCCERTGRSPMAGRVCSGAGKGGMARRTVEAGSEEWIRRHSPVFAAGRGMRGAIRLRRRSPEGLRLHRASRRSVPSPSYRWRMS